MLALRSAMFCWKLGEILMQILCWTAVRGGSVVVAVVLSVGGVPFLGGDIRDVFCFPLRQASVPFQLYLVAHQLG